MAGSQSPENAEVIPPNVISTYTKKISQLILRMQYPDSIKVASGNLDDVLKEINRVSGEMLAWHYTEYCRLSLLRKQLIDKD